VIAKYYLIEHSSAALLNCAVKLDASDIISEARLYAAIRFPFSDWNTGSKLLASKKLAFPISFSVRKWD